MTGLRATAEQWLAVVVFLGAVLMSGPAEGAPGRTATVATRHERLNRILARITGAGVLDRTVASTDPGGEVVDAAKTSARTNAIRRAKRFRREVVGIGTTGLPEEVRTSRDVMLYELDRRIRELARPGRDGAPAARSYADAIREETTTDLTADEVCSIGLREVAEIERRLTGMARAAGFNDLYAYRTALDADPGNVPRSAAQIVDDIEKHVDMARPRLARIVRDPPATPLVVEPMPPGALPNITHHVDGSVIEGRPGQILVTVSEPSNRSLLGDEAVAFHEGLPGHELQVAIEQRLQDLPGFRRQLRYGAYSEGWAVYAEGLGTELGIDETASSAFGRVTLDLTRALRLVADTGMHARGWSRERVAAYLRASGVEDDPTVEAEMDRIAVWPGQGLAYKIGQLKFLQLRERARAALGDAFDLRDFHDVVLRGGSVPLSVLEHRVDRWIAERRGRRRYSPYGRSIARVGQGWHCDA